MSVRQLSTAEERRETLVEAAVEEFAKHGLHGTPTLDIAQLAGISHPYLFKFFPTKVALFVAAAERASYRVRRALGAAAAHATASARDPLTAMRREYLRLLHEDRSALLVWLHAQAAAGEPEVGEAARQMFTDFVATVRQHVDGREDELERFCAECALVNAMAALDHASPSPAWGAVLPSW